MEIYADSPFIFESISRVYLRLPGKKPKPCLLEGWRVHQGNVLLLVDRSQGRDQADAWRGADVLVREKDLPELEDDEYRIDDLLDLPVWHTKGDRIGILEDIQDIAGQEIWFIRDDQGNEIMLPAVEQFVLEIDLEAGRITVDPPEGLLELYQKS